MGRNDLCFCGSGLKQKKCHKEINEQSKWAKIYKVNQAFDSAVQASGVKSFCSTSCSICCDALFPVSEESFLFIVDNLCHGDFSLLEDHIKHAWEISEIVQRDFPDYWKQLTEKMPSIRGTQPPDLRYWGGDFELNSSLPRCMFLSEEGKCQIYDYRPHICRSFGTSYGCEISNNDLVAKEEHQEMYEAYNYIVSSNNQRIMKRPYPLFYWFTHFLEYDWKREIMLQSLRKFKTSSEDAYFHKNKI